MHSGLWMSRSETAGFSAPTPDRGHSWTQTNIATHASDPALLLGDKVARHSIGRFGLNLAFKTQNIATLTAA